MSWLIVAVVTLFCATALYFIYKYLVAWPRRPRADMHYKE